MENKKIQFNTEIWQKIIILIMPFIFYANTINLEYALDDAIVITNNKFTKKGFNGIKDILSNDTFTGFFGTKKNLVAGGRYRPLSQISFALEYQLFQLNPKISHIINILLYSLTGFLIFIVVKKLIPEEQKKFGLLSIPFITALIYLMHPVHTEVITNIKGRDEIFSMLFSLLSTLSVIQYLNKNKVINLALASLYFFLGLLSKENTAMFIPVIFLAVLLFTDHSIKKNLICSFALIIPLIIFIKIRLNVLGTMLSEPSNELMNDPFLLVKTGEKSGTILYTLGLYIKLLFYPHPLTYDYYPFHIKYVQLTDLKALLPLIAYISALCYSGYHALKTLFIKNYKIKSIGKKIIVFSLLYYLITLSIVSNIVFPVGTFMNERFLYMPSLGFCLLISWLIIDYIPTKFDIKSNLIPISIIVIMLFPSFIKTTQRNKAWKNDFTLFTTDVKTSSNSAKSNCSAGGKLLEESQKTKNSKKKKEYLDQSLIYLKKSLEIYPTYIDASVLMGNALFEAKAEYKEIAHYYKIALMRAPKYQQVITNITIVANSLDSTTHKIAFLEEFYNLNPNVFDWNYQLGTYYGRELGDIKTALKYFKKAVLLNPSDSRIHKDLGVAYGFNKEYKKSIIELEKAAKLTPNDLQIYRNIAISYGALGDRNMEQEYLKKSRGIK